MLGRVGVTEGGCVLGRVGVRGWVGVREGVCVLGRVCVREGVC